MDGSVIRAAPNQDSTFYGRPVKSRDVLFGPIDSARAAPRLSPTSIRRIRSKAAVSQAVFAAYLNVTTGVVSKWERGEKQPRGPAAKLLSLAAKHGLAAIA